MNTSCCGLQLAGKSALANLGISIPLGLWCFRMLQVVIMINIGSQTVTMTTDSERSTNMAVLAFALVC